MNDMKEKNIREKEMNEMVDRIFEAEKADKKFVTDLIEENKYLRELIEYAFVAGRGKTSWKQFKKDHKYYEDTKLIRRIGRE